MVMGFHKDYTIPFCHVDYHVVVIVVILTTCTYNVFNMISQI